MTNLKKIGLSALAGSLVAFSANAVEMGVSGTAEVTYTTNGGKGSGVTGNPWGSNTAISFSGSGDVGFGTATIVRTLQDGANHGTQTDNFVSAYQTVDMGDLGTLSFDSAGGGLEGVTAYDDLLPTAYEEVWNGVGSGTSYNAGAASNDTIGYSNSFGAFGISLAQTKGGTRATGDGGNGGTVTATTSDWVLTLDGSSLVDGLNGGVMASSASSSLAALLTTK
jgi:outer membrane protein OmpU